jgi:hypothetical protein
MVGVTLANWFRRCALLDEAEGDQMVLKFEEAKSITVVKGIRSTIQSTAPWSIRAKERGHRQTKVVNEDYDLGILNAILCFYMQYKLLDDLTCGMTEI